MPPGIQKDDYIKVVWVTGQTQYVGYFCLEVNCGDDGDYQKEPWAQHLPKIAVVSVPPPASYGVF